MSRNSLRRLVWFSISASCVLLFALSFTIGSYAEAPDETAWKILESGVQQHKTGERITAVRVLSLVTLNPHAIQLAESALGDPSPDVRVAAATALGQMESSASVPKLKGALNDKDLHVVMAAAHALSQLKDPACYEVYYAILTGQRRDNEGLIAGQMEVLHDPKQLAEMGFNEGIGYVPFAGIPWDALEAILKNRKNSAAAKAGVIAALASDPDARTADALVAATQNENWVIRVAALEAIAKRGDPALMPKIQKSLDDSRDEVKYTGAAVIVHLGTLSKTHNSGVQN